MAKVLITMVDNAGLEDVEELEFSSDEEAQQAFDEIVAFTAGDDSAALEPDEVETP